MDFEDKINMNYETFKEVKVVIYTNYEYGKENNISVILPKHLITDPPPKVKMSSILCAKIKHGIKHSPIQKWIVR